MDPSDTETLKPLAGMDGVAAFDEAWQAEALAIADNLVRDGLFSAGDWSQALGEALREAEAARTPDRASQRHRCQRHGGETRGLGAGLPVDPARTARQVSERRRSLTLARGATLLAGA